MPEISVAAVRGDAESMQVIIDDHQRRGNNVGELVNAMAHGWTPMHEASSGGHVEAVQVLLAAGAA